VHVVYQQEQKTNTQANNWTTVGNNKKIETEKNLEKAAVKKNIRYIVPVVY
jgi:hypothetical protein